MGMAILGIQPTGRRQLTIGVALVAALIAGACSSKADNTSPTSTTPKGADTTVSGDTTPGDTPTAAAGAAGPLGFRLSQGTSQAAAAIPTPVVQGTPFDQARIDEIFSRLPEWITDDITLTKPFNWPVETLPPPRVGQTVDVPFPQVPDAGGPPAPPAGPLEVVRRQPEGDVPIAPFVSITFNQPMVALTTLEQLDQATVPATISPAVPGRWQWIGTQTLRFDATNQLVDRLPMATEFTVTIPQGTKSANDGELAADVSWSLTTPAPKVLSFQPADNSSLTLEPVFVATFDQRVDPAAVLATITLKAGDAKPTVRVATQAEIDADEIAGQIVSSATQGRWVAFRATDPLPADSAIGIEIGPGTPSAEGPLTTADATTYSNRTFAALAVLGTECGYGPNCPPSTDFNINFNNPLDAATFDPATITIEPTLNAVIGVYGSTINVRGNTTANTTYTVTIPTTVRDIHGQTLAEEQTVTVEIGKAMPMMVTTQPLVTLDPLATTADFTVSSAGHKELKVRVYQVRPGDWASFTDYMNQFNGDPSVTPKAPTWPSLVDTTVKVDGDVNAITPTSVDLSKYLTNRRGHLVVIVEPTEKYDINNELYWQNRPAISWVQGTSIGLDAIVDNDEMVIWATDLATGAALDGVTIDVGPGKSVTTDADGLSRTATALARTLTATKGDDVAILPPGYYGEQWQSYPLQDEARWFVFDDRQIYRPGETISVKGWVRKLAMTDNAQLRLFDTATGVDWTLFDGQGNELASGTAAISAVGGFDLTAEIKPEANLGYAYFNLKVAGETGVPYTEFQHGLQIQEFRRPEFEVTARAESPGPYLDTKPATVAVDANYFAGGPLPAAPVEWQVTTAPATYSPPGWDGFTFGIWQPWWYGDYGYGGGYGGGTESTTAAGATPVDRAFRVSRVTAATSRRSRASPMATATTSCRSTSRLPRAGCPTCRPPSRRRPPSPT